MGHNSNLCEDDEDAKRMAEGILRNLGYVNMFSGGCALSVNDLISSSQLRDIARSGERIARWARAELKRRPDR